MTDSLERSCLEERGFEIEPDAELAGRLIAALGDVDEEELSCRAADEEMTVYWCDGDVINLLLGG